MATVFTKIIDGELPARFVWRDDVCVGFLSINPLATGHVLVVPRAETDHWIDVDDDTWAHVTRVSQLIGQALQRAYDPAKVGMMLAGLEVPHTHVHLVPMNNVHDLDFANAEADPDPDELDRAAETIRTTLRDMGGAAAGGVAD
jgi:histidine triad (HIT) family protein